MAGRRKPGRRRPRPAARGTAPRPAGSGARPAAAAPAPAAAATGAQDDGPQPAPLALRTISPRDALTAAAIAVLATVSYLPALSGGFVWDDVIFAEEPVIHAVSGLKSIWFSPADIRNEGHYRPLVYTSFWLEHKPWGLQPAGYHAVNILLHSTRASTVRCRAAMAGRTTVPLRTVRDYPGAACKRSIVPKEDR